MDIPQAIDILSGQINHASGYLDSPLDQALQLAVEALFRILVIRQFPHIKRYIQAPLLREDTPVGT